MLDYTIFTIAFVFNFVNFENEPLCKPNPLGLSRLMYYTKQTRERFCLPEHSSISS